MLFAHKHRRALPELARCPWAARREGEIPVGSLSACKQRGKALLMMRVALIKYLLMLLFHDITFIVSK